jgi:hypothetical protein
MRFAAAHSVLETKNTGNYTVKLVDDGEEYHLLVQYTGEWAGGDEVEVWLEPSSGEEPEPAEMQAWFKHQVRGDRDVMGLLSHGGYDEYTNGRGSKPVKIHVAGGAMGTGLSMVQRVFLRYAFSKDPKVVEREFEKLRGALKHLEQAYTKNYDLTETPNFHAYSQAIEAFRNVKFFIEHAGGSVGEPKGLVILSKNPFVPANAVAEDSKVFKDALHEVDALEHEFQKVQKAAA